ncbi:MAG TPA: ATP-dependent DNA helicase RecG [Feifaniaceae bacterium]|nr:ATP-dependent DNA helicase RecG [Feifaniaceae bacterium]
MTTPVSALKGIGAARAAAFQKLSVNTVEELLYFLPREYRDFSTLKTVNGLVHGEFAAVRLQVKEEPKLIRPSRALQLVTVRAQDETGQMQVNWFNQPYRKNALHAGQFKVFCGRVDAARGLRLVNPSVSDEPPGILPVYPLVQGLFQHHVRDAVGRALELSFPYLKETLPEPLLSRYGLCGIKEALLNVHFPRDQEVLSQARRRLSFEDMLYYLMAVGLRKRARAQKEGVSFMTHGVREAFLKSLPYAPTDAQRRVLKEIEEGMQSPLPMNRLIQGDVGSGKTMLALYAIQAAVQNGYQSAMMAPTEILAQQHYQQLVLRHKDAACLLCGGMKKKEREEAYRKIETGEIKVAVGTHALLQSGLVFHRLGLVVTDEQHRFGVRQRAQLINKSEKTPDVLIMSATPIPRTLAMLLYGDLELSVLDELPPGRKPVLTRLVPEEKREDMYRFIGRQVTAGRQAYVVCPLVEPSEQMEIKSAQDVYGELVSLLPHARIALLHGRMAAAKKEEAIASFRAGHTDILVSTTVVEVGVDVPNAAIMAVESAERFGLAQLHQLRGRVGRGTAQSFCFLLYGPGGDTAKTRLETMVKTNDGFVIAQRDLELRGPGEFFGTRQHGADELSAAKIAANMDVLFEAQRAADALLGAGETAETSAVFLRAQTLYETRMREIANN